MKGKDRAKSVTIHAKHKDTPVQHHKKVSVVHIINDTMTIVFNDEDKDDVQYNLNYLAQVSIQ